MRISRLSDAAQAHRWYLGMPGVSPSVCRTCAPGSRADGKLLRHMRDAKGPTRMPPQPHPDKLAKRYSRRLDKRTRDINGVTVRGLQKAMTPRRRTAINARAAKQDNQATDTQALLRVVDEVERAVGRAGTVREGEALGTLANQVRKFTGRSVTNQVRTVTGLEVLPTLGQHSAILGKWATDNVALIKSLDSRYFDDIRGAITATVGEGMSTEALTRAIQERFGVARSRAQLVAVDQVGKLNGQITMERQTSLGIESYIWSTSGDDRVRPDHEAIDGKQYRWDTGHPTEGHPGMPVRCRCSAIPVI